MAQPHQKRRTGEKEAIPSVKIRLALSYQTSSCVLGICFQDHCFAVPTPVLSGRLSVTSLGGVPQKKIDGYHWV